MIKISGLRRLFEAAKKDGTPERFFHDVGQALEKRELKASDFSIRALFENFVEGGREAVDSWNPRHGEGEGVVTMAILEETGAVTSGGFGKITGQIVYSAILAAYDAEDFVFSKIVPAIPTVFNGEKIPGISRIGDEAEAIDEGRPYPNAGVSQDYIETPVTTKRGEIVGLTREAIFFDRTNILVERCSDVGLSLGINKEKRVIDGVIDENTTAARYKWRGTVYATYQSSTPWINLQATNGLVDWTNLQTVEILISQLTDPWTGEPILVYPRHLVVTRNNLHTANRAVGAPDVRVATPGFATSGNPTQTQARNPMQNVYEVVTSNLLAHRMSLATSWYLGDITKAFAYMENWPLTTVQAPSNSEVEFTHDVVMRWKASERGAMATKDPRWMAKSTA